GAPGGPKERRLLAVLVLHIGEVVSVDALAEALWDGAPPRSAVKSVQVYVTRWRAALGAGEAGAGALRTVGRGYRLAVDRDAVDAYVSRALTPQPRRDCDRRQPTVVFVDPAAGKVVNRMALPFAGKVVPRPSGR